MLEYPALLLLPPDATGCRSILEGPGGTLVGSARPREHGDLPWWRRPLWPVLEVRESEDEPLLFTVCRSWSLLPRREVCDADGRRVGYLHGEALDDAWGRRVAVRSWEGARNSGTFRLRNGKVLAWTEREKEGLRLTFAETAAGEPFLKMLLLGAALLLEASGRS
jgi:hypothetical protein